MSQITLGRKNSDDDLEPITLTNPVERCTVVELPMQNVTTVMLDRGICFSVYPSFIAVRFRDALPHIATLDSTLPGYPRGKTHQAYKHGAARRKPA